MMKQQSPVQTMERRGCPRHASPNGTWQVSVLGESTPRTARVRDLSTSGIGLLFDEEIRVDKMVVVELFNSIRHCWYLKTIRLLYAIPQADGRCLAGGSFLHPLSAQDCGEVLLDPLRESRSLFEEEAIPAPASAHLVPPAAFSPQI